jgi:hypothetical protein
MLRGIPVLASDSGGNREAKLGTKYLLPVNIIERFERNVDENMLPFAVIPAQDLRPWEQAVRELLSNADAYRQEAEASRRAAISYVAGLGIDPLEELLTSHSGPPQEEVSPGPKGIVKKGLVGSLSPGQLSLIVMRAYSRHASDTRL